MDLEDEAIVILSWTSGSDFFVMAPSSQEQVLSPWGPESPNSTQARQQPCAGARQAAAASGSARAAAGGQLAGGTLS